MQYIMRNTVKALGLLFLVLWNSTSYGQKDKKEIDDAITRDLRVDNAQRTEKSAFFDDGNYAMFIHWGIYSNIGDKWKDSTYYGISEWIKSPQRADIPDKEYMAEAKKFNPVNFDAKSIVQLAKSAGMKYIIVTSKHHDGFAMYDSKSNDFNIVDASPFARDPMKELAKACKEEGLGFGFYYSHNQDWTFPGGNGGPKTNEKGEEVDFDYYFKNKCLPQVKEITTEYGDIAIVWFDTPGDMEKKYVEELVEIVHKNQPNALISGRAGHGLGDYNSLGDMNIPVKNVGGLWETVDVTNDSWGYAWYDQNWKSPKRILKSVISTVARGGTYMLNVGPKPDGTIPIPAATALSVSGEWIHRYPEVIYAAAPSPWNRKLPWGDVTVSGNQLNLCIYDWPTSGKLYVPGLKNDIKSANLWVDGKQIPLVSTQKGEWLVVELPSKQPEKLVSVVTLEVANEVQVDKTMSLDPVLPTKLSVTFANQSEGCTVMEKKWMEKFGEWKTIAQAQDWETGGSLTWEVDVFEPGYYQVDLNYSGEGRLVWKTETEEGNLVQNQQDSSNRYDYFQMGLLKFESAGKHKVSVSLVNGNRTGASLQDIRFTPLSSLE